MVDEMKKLRDLLDAEGIAWKDRSNGEKDIDRTHFWFRKYKWSVVNGGEPIGWLTAEEVMKYVRGEDDAEMHIR